LVHSDAPAMQSVAQQLESTATQAPSVVEVDNDTQLYSTSVLFGQFWKTVDGVRALGSVHFGTHEQTPVAGLV